MNASVHLLRRVVPATVHLRAEIAEDLGGGMILEEKRLAIGKPLERADDPCAALDDRELLASGGSIIQRDIQSRAAKVHRST